MGFSIFGSGGHFVQQSRTILASLPLKVFSIFSSKDHFVQWSGTILALLVEGHPRNIPVKLF